MITTPPSNRLFKSTNYGTDPYYKNDLFNAFVPITILYTAMTHLALLLLKPCPLFRIHPSKLEIQDRFMVSTTTPTATPSNINIVTHNESQLVVTRPIAIVTGSNTGIGFETSSSLVESGYNVILACRSRDKGEEAATKINQRFTGKNNKSSSSTNVGKAIFLHPLDLSSLDSIRSFAKEFSDNYKHLNILVNNAGINTTGKSIDNMDLCFQTNFVGHYLLTRLLIPHLLLAKNQISDRNGDVVKVEAGRVVNLSSVTHHFARADEKRILNTTSQDSQNKLSHSDQKWWRQATIPGVSSNTYKESKLASLLLTHELNRQYGSQGLRAVSANPGSVNSDIWRGYSKYLIYVFKLIYLDNKQGSTTSVAAAIGNLPEHAVYLQPYWQPFSKRLKNQQSTSFQHYYRLPFPPTEMLGPYVGFAVTDPRLPSDVDNSSAALWDVCEELVGLKSD